MKLITKCLIAELYEIDGIDIIKDFLSRIPEVKENGRFQKEKLPANETQNSTVGLFLREK